MENRLSASDLSNLFAERGQVHVTVGGTIIVEGVPPAYEELVAHVEDRLNWIPRFRQRVVKVPLGFENPIWGDDPKFDVRRHVRNVAIPRPGRLDQLRDLVGRIMSEPLDMERPLWQIYLIDGLRGGRHAYLSKTHHALVDGVAAVDIGMILLDPKRSGTQAKGSKEPWRPEELRPGEVFAQAALYAVQRPFRAVGRAARTTVSMPARTARRVIRTAEAITELAAAGPKSPRSPLNVEIGRDRRIAWVRADLDRLKRARAAAEGSTVNDVVLSVVAGALRSFLQGRGDEVPEHLVALVPVSIRRPDEDGELGNRISTILVRLPLAESDPRKRLAGLRDETARLKETDNARAASLIIEATGWAPPTINRVLSHAMARPLVFNLVVSNVPGPQQPLYLLGRQVREVYPVVPLSPQNHALSIGLLSYDGRVFFGLNGDRDAVPDLDDLAAALREALREQPVPRRAPKPTPAPRRATAARKRAPAKVAAKRGKGTTPRRRPAAKAKPQGRARTTSKASASRPKRGRRPASRGARGRRGRPSSRRSS
jgi:WS/DGAT/MGAT family acyltransferase